MDTNGNDVYLPCVSYHLPLTDAPLFSSQIYHQLHGGHSVVNGDEVEMKFCKEGAAISIPIYRNSTNLPIVYNSFVSKNINKKNASKFRSSLHATGLYAALDCFSNMSLDQNFSTLSRTQGLFSRFPCVGGLKNENLLMPQKELLLWNWKLGIRMQRLQAMMRTQTFEDPFGRLHSIPPIIKTKFASTSSCAIPKCQSCELAWAQQRPPKVKKVQLNLDSEGAISCNKLEVGDFVSTDQFVCRTPGQLPSGYRRENLNNRFHGGTIYNDAASGRIWVENQVSLGSSETIMGK